MRRRGFVLIEVMAVVVILAVLASIGIAGFNKTKYKTQKNQAIIYLRSLRTAQKLYWGRWKYYACQTANSCDTEAEIKSVLGVETTINNFGINVTASATTFSARATDNVSSKYITIDQAGTWGGDYSPLPPN